MAVVLHLKWQQFTVDGSAIGHLVNGKKSSHAPDLKYFSKKMKKIRNFSIFFSFSFQLQEIRK
jgi:hypothetical protein